MAKETKAHSSIFIHPSTGTNVATEARLNSPHTKWPYQPKVLRASPNSVFSPQPLSLGTMAGAFPTLTEPWVPPRSASALGWAWTTVSTWLGPAHPSLSPCPCVLG